MTRVDVRGEPCPRPALVVRERLADLTAGDTLEVVGDHGPARRNIRRVCEERGCDVTAVDAPPGEFELHVRILDGATLPEW
jgi:tRNA 2-thiouridine synthesizing protein A